MALGDSQEATTSREGGCHGEQGTIWERGMQARSFGDNDIDTEACVITTAGR